MPSLCRFRIWDPPGQPQQDSGISPGIFGADLALLDGTHQGLVPNGPPAGLLDDQLSQAAPSTPPLLPLLLDGAWVEPPPGEEVMSLNNASSSMGDAVGNRRPMEFDISNGDRDPPMWEPKNWVLMRERQVQRDICMPVHLMEKLSLMSEKQSEEIVMKLRGNLNELADACLARTQILAGSVCEISNVQKRLWIIIPNSPLP